MLRPNYLQAALLSLVCMGLVSFAATAGGFSEQLERLEIRAYSRGNSLTFENPQPLNFGSFVPLDGGTLQLRPDGQLITSGQVTPQGGHESGLLSIQQGLENQEIWIEFSANDLTLSSNTGGAHTMSVQNFVLAATGDGAELNSNLNRLKLNQNGQADLAVGATLIVGENQAPGSYSGTLEINLRFQ